MRKYICATLIGCLWLFDSAFVSAATWVPVGGNVFSGSTPLCAMVLVNGQSQFSCDGAGRFDMEVPLDSNGMTTFQVFVDGFAPFKQTISPQQARDFRVSMSRSSGGRALQVSSNVDPSEDGLRAIISGTVNAGSTPVCAMVLANGQQMFSCNSSLGLYDLNVPLDDNGNITLMVFAGGFTPYKQVIRANGLPFAPPTDVYDADYWRNLNNELDAGGFDTDSYLYTYLPNVANCDPGALTTAAKSRALETLNEIRGLHRLPPVAYDAFYDSEVQSASLVHRANANTAHYPPPTARCYSQLAASGASSSNLHRSSSHEPDDPASDIIGWIDDKFNRSDVMAVGHRRWALYPELGYLAYGQVNGASAQKVHSFGREPLVETPPDLQVVAFPYRTYPYLLLEKADKPTPWSLSLTPAGYNDYQYEYFRNSTVTVSDWNTGAKLRVYNLYTDTKRSGTPNILSWLVDGYEYDTSYRVRIENITYPDGQQHYLEYYVYLDYYNIIDITEPLEAGDRKDGNQLKGSFANSDDKDSYSVTLSGNKQFKGESRFSNQAFYVHVYDARKRLVASYDEAFQQNFEAGEYTVVASLCTEDGFSYCYNSPINYTITIN